MCILVLKFFTIRRIQPEQGLSSEPVAVMAITLVKIITILTIDDHDIDKNYHCYQNANSKTTPSPVQVQKERKHIYTHKHTHIYRRKVTSTDNVPLQVFGRVAEVVSNRVGKGK